MQVYYDKDGDIGLIKARRVAMIGYGSQGFAHANNLQESGIQVIVGLRPEGASWAKAEAAGLVVKKVEEAVQESDFIMILVPDELQPELFKAQIQPHLSAGDVLAFGHGFNIHFGLITPPDDVDVVMVAPKGPGHTVRSAYSEGGGVPMLIAVHQNVSGQARDLSLAYACAIGGGRAGVIETNFREETETDLFGEQAVLCGGVSALVQAGFETLVEAGYAPEMAYFECLHELKLIVDFFYEGGITNMWYTVSNTAEYGGLTRGSRIITEETKMEMRYILDEIQRGEFAREFVNENQAGAPGIQAMRRLSAEHPIEAVGKKLRGMMPWIQQQALVDKSKN